MSTFPIHAAGALLGNIFPVFSGKVKVKRGFCSQSSWRRPGVPVGGQRGSDGGGGQRGSDGGGGQRSSCGAAAASSLGSACRTEASDLLAATSLHPLLLSHKNGAPNPPSSTANDHSLASHSPQMYASASKGLLTNKTLQQVLFHQMFHK